MPAHNTTRAQVNGYRFLLRRLEHALIRGDSRMIHDPMRGQSRSMLVGLVLAVIIVGACAVLAFFKPQPSVGDAQILLSQSNGAIFVRIGERAHPALNVASARLIAGTSENPAAVDDKKLAALQRGPVVGIIGAPLTISGADDMSASDWTVCDTTVAPAAVEPTGGTSVQTMVSAGPPVLTDEIRTGTAADAVAVNAGGQTFLLFDGVRAPIDLTDRVLAPALGLTGVPVRDVSPGLLNAFPLVPAITAVAIPRAGEPAPPPLPASVRIGSVIKTTDTSGDSLFVVLADGVQPISAATADIIRYADPSAEQQPQTLSPALLTSVATVNQLPVQHYPQVAPTFSDTRAEPVVCMSWRRGNTETTSSTALLLGRRLPIPHGAHTVPLAGADGGGPGLDAVYVKPGTGEYVQSVGAEPAAAGIGQLFYVADTGQRFHIAGPEAAAVLGVRGIDDPAAPRSEQKLPQPAPWSVLSLLPAGPVLSREAALIAHDGMQADPEGRRIQPPQS